MRARFLTIIVLAAVLVVLPFLLTRREIQPVRHSQRSDAEHLKSAKSSAQTTVLDNMLPDVAETPTVRLAPRLDLGTGQLGWEKRIATVLEAAELSDASKARALLDLLPVLPAEAWETATREAVERLPDRDFAAAHARLINPHTDGMILSVLYADLLERPDEIALPTLLTIARMPAHPLASHALDGLELLLGQSFGSEWHQWQGQIQRVLGDAR